MPPSRQKEVEEAQKSIDFSKTTYQVELDTTMGKILLDLYPDVAPGHCQNIIALAKIGYYDGVGFHRVVAARRCLGRVARGGASVADRQCQPRRRGQGSARSQSDEGELELHLLAVDRLVAELGPAIVHDVAEVADVVLTGLHHLQSPIFII